MLKSIGAKGVCNRRPAQVWRIKVGFPEEVTLKMGPEKSAGRKGLSRQREQCVQRP